MQEARPGSQQLSASGDVPRTSLPVASPPHWPGGVGPVNLAEDERRTTLGTSSAQPVFTAQQNAAQSLPAFGSTQSASNDPSTFYMYGKNSSTAHVQASSPTSGPTVVITSGKYIYIYKLYEI